MRRATSRKPSALGLWGLETPIGTPPPKAVRISRRGGIATGRGAPGVAVSPVNVGADAYRPASTDHAPRLCQQYPSHSPDADSAERREDGVARHCDFSPVP